MLIVQILLLIIGFVILIKGADIFVDGASAVARHFKISKMLIGLTIVAFGTSAPEFAVSVKSILSGSGDIVLGNVIGSNILNILLILGVAGLVHSLNVKSHTVQKELPLVLLFTTLFAVLILDSLFDATAANSFTRSDGIILVLFFLVFVYYLFNMMRHRTEEETAAEEKQLMPVGRAALFTVLGIIGIVLGSNFVVDGASALATAFGVSEKLIALTIIALGTSLPELVTSVTATRKGEYDIAIGNVVGSNIFNIGIVLGLPVAVLGGIGDVAFNYIDIIAMLLAAALLFIFSLRDHKITKKEALVFLALFVIYYAYVIITGLS